MSFQSPGGALAAESQDGVRHLPDGHVRAVHQHRVLSLAQRRDLRFISRLSRSMMSCSICSRSQGTPLAVSSSYLLFAGSGCWLSGRLSHPRPAGRRCRCPGPSMTTFCLRARSRCRERSSLSPPGWQSFLKPYCPLPPAQLGGDIFAVQIDLLLSLLIADGNLGVPAGLLDLLRVLRLYALLQEVDASPLYMAPVST